MSHTTSQIYTVAVGSVRNVAIDLTDELDSGELLTGTPIILEQTTSDLTISSKSVSTASLDILKVTVAIGKAVQCTISGMLAGVTYSVAGTVATDSTPAQTIPFKIRIKGESA